METISIIIGIGIVLSILIYLGFKLDNEHIAIKSFFILSFFFLVLLIPKALIDSNQTCEILDNTTTEIYIYGDNYSGYHSDYDFQPTTIDELNLFHRNITHNYNIYCFDNNSNTPIIFYRGLLTMLVIVMSYLFIYIFDKWANRGMRFGN